MCKGSGYVDSDQYIGFSKNVKEKRMKKLEDLNVKYVGYAVPVTEDEVELEILGLELAIKCAEQRIALLNQGLKV